jgi:hypothetical protein
MNEWIGLLYSVVCYNNKCLNCVGKSIHGKVWLLKGYDFSKGWWERLKNY